SSPPSPEARVHEVKAPPMTSKGSKERQRSSSASVNAASSVSLNAARPEIFNWAEPPVVAEKLLLPMPADLFQPGQRVPVERWIFGQQNRAFPAKVNSRLFIGQVLDAGGEVELFEAASAISTQAAAV